MSKMINYIQAQKWWALCAWVQATRKRGTGTAVATVRSKSQEHKVPRCTEADELDHLQYLFSNTTSINKLGELGIFLFFHFEHLVCCQASLRRFMNLEKATWINVISLVFIHISHRTEKSRWKCPCEDVIYFGRKKAHNKKPSPHSQNSHNAL